MVYFNDLLQINERTSCIQFILKLKLKVLKLNPKDCNDVNTDALGASNIFKMEF